MSFSENEIYSIEDIMDEVQRTNPSIRSVFVLQPPDCLSQDEKDYVKGYMNKLI
jgi:hypothetical protein